MIYWNIRTPLRLVASLIWNITESLNLPLGNLAPIIFGLMIGAKSKKKIK